MKNLLVYIIIFCGIGCVAKKSNSVSQSNLAAINVAGDYFKGNNYHFKYNQDSTYLLCYQQKNVQNKQGMNKLNIAVFNVHSGDIVYENQLNFGSVKWVDRYTIEMKEGKGFMDENQNAHTIRKHNVRQQQYLEKNK